MRLVAFGTFLASVLYKTFWISWFTETSVFKFLKPLQIRRDAIVRPSFTVVTLEPLESFIFSANAEVRENTLYDGVYF